MTPKQFPHKQFLEDNSQAIAKRPLPEFLIKRIRGFEELEEDLPHTTDEDREQLEARLERLSHELDQDLEEYFEHELENNDLDEDEPDEPAADLSRFSADTKEPDWRSHEDPSNRPDPSRAIREQGFDKPDHNTRKSTLSEKNAPERETEGKQKPGQEPVPGHTDEDIIARLVADGKTEIQPQKLKALGFKASLIYRRLKVGRYTLHRRRYDTAYRIIS